MLSYPLPPKMQIYQFDKTNSLIRVHIYFRECRCESNIFFLTLCNGQSTYLYVSMHRSLFFVLFLPKYIIPNQITQLYSQSIIETNKELDDSLRIQPTSWCLIPFKYECLKSEYVRKQYTYIFVFGSGKARTQNDLDNYYHLSLQFVQQRCSRFIKHIDVPNNTHPLSR